MQDPAPAHAAQLSSHQGTVGEVFSAFLKLGLTCFGGPIAHIGYFRDEFVTRRRWFDDQSYADLVALSQFLPGPASSKVGMSIGLWRAGYAGMLAAWIAFTLPSALALIAFAFGVQAIGDAAGAGWLRGFKIVAVPVVAQAVYGMAVNLCPDRERAALAAVTAAIALLVPTVYGQVGAIILGAVIGLTILRTEARGGQSSFAVPVNKPVAVMALIALGALLVVLPVVVVASGSPALAMFEKFYRAGALVFGGGHVVLPLLQADIVQPGWVGAEQFVAGYGATQAVPGPLFTFAAYLGFMMGPWPNGIVGAALCLVAIFLPAALLVIGTLPFWATLRTMASVQSALRGVNAAVVGILLAALYNPVWVSGIHVPGDFALAAAGGVLLMVWKTPPWLVVGLTALGGAAFAWLGF